MHNGTHIQRKQRNVGSLSLAFDQSAQINATATQVCAGTRYVIWGSDNKGTMVYEVNPSEVGTNLFTDPTIATWTALQTFSHQMVSETAGYGTMNTSTMKAPTKP